jgi:hypothetical protein
MSNVFLDLLSEFGNKIKISFRPDLLKNDIHHMFKPNCWHFEDLFGVYAPKLKAA